MEDRQKGNVSQVGMMPARAGVFAFRSKGLYKRNRRACVSMEEGLQNAVVMELGPSTAFYILGSWDTFDRIKMDLVGLS